jgi:hypothetical protein
MNTTKSSELFAEALITYSGRRQFAIRAFKSVGRDPLYIKSLRART